MCNICLKLWQLLVLRSDMCCFGSNCVPYTTLLDWRDRKLVYPEGKVDDDSPAPALFREPRKDRPSCIVMQQKRVVWWEVGNSMWSLEQKCAVTGFSRICAALKWKITKRNLVLFVFYLISSWVAAVEILIKSDVFSFGELST